MQYKSTYTNTQLNSVNELLISFNEDDCYRSKENIQISHRPKVAPEAYAIILFPGIEITNISLSIPRNYFEILKELNGAIFYELYLYGVPQSNLLKRDGTQQLSLITANEDWKHEYIGTKDLFHFGGCAWNLDMNVGYFLNNNNEVLSILNDGTVVNQWHQFNNFLSEEIERAKSIYPEYEKFMSNLQNENA
jgi:hypothetical protein